ncbi:phosphoinositide phosphatase SAC2 isoform X2 [Ziziphus jujuba]|uniref:Phosphoinositide phosphatase SAC2 isoform X2 n=1 Tax=Ziziphus jujuba TaxID=326968 RepID=A0A6P4BH02_ZIZJJ|nr:phosphoinositide phosphatase SAC2 isoform X2 [Ziziphus jujuba]
MEAKREFKSCINGESNQDSFYLQKFKLYETRSNFYMIGRDKNRTIWRVLKIDRSDPSELNIWQDSATYSENECYDLLRRVDEGNKAIGGLKFVTTCYGIIGFVKFLEPYYMLVITKRRKIGAICGHTIYAITKSEMIPVPNSTVRSNLAYSKDENRYKKYLCTVDLTKDFYFSYSYNIMRCLQKNLCDNRTGPFLYETMFVWNEYLTRGIRNTLDDTLWTVALVYGFFKQVDLSVSGKDFKLTLIARRSRHYAGTRYLRRGVNEKGRVANDVETEQIVIENAPEGFQRKISSVVQHRGSIPLFWSHETSRMNIKPDIILSRKDPNYEATRLHFENLFKRYGTPIIILNLIKRREKKPRETILHREFTNAISFINRNLTPEKRLRFHHWDLHKHSRSKETNVLLHLGKVAEKALEITEVFYCQVTPNLRPVELFNGSCFENNTSGDRSLEKLSSENESADYMETKICNSIGSDSGAGSGSSCDYGSKSLMFQKGVLRTNCIDCLDRTNVAQYAYGLAALGFQLNALGFLESSKIDLDDPLAKDLMDLYETMGDILALQYGGSAAHNKVFSKRRGQWSATTQSQEFIRTLQRFYNNTYVDGEKQKAINLFLGHYQPQQGKPALWELDSDQHYNVGRCDLHFADENVRLTIKRSLSDGNILCESDSQMASTDIADNQLSSEAAQGNNKGLSDSAPEISTIKCPMSYCRGLQEDKLLDSDHVSCEHDDDCNFSNFLDSNWLSSSGNSCEEDSHGSLSPKDVVKGLKIEMTTSRHESGSFHKGQEHTEPELNNDGVVAEFSKSFVDWVVEGGLLSHGS